MTNPQALYHAERKKRGHTQIAIPFREWQQALAEYHGWYKDLEARAEHTMGLDTPRHMRRQLVFGAHCFIHARVGITRPTKAKGLCITCYCRLRHQKNDPRRKRRYWRYNIVCGHLHKPHHGHGMCRNCWQKTHGRGMRILQKRRARARKALASLPTGSARAMCGPEGQLNDDRTYGVVDSPEITPAYT